MKSMDLTFIANLVGAAFLLKVLAYRVRTAMLQRASTPRPLHQASLTALQRSI